MPGRQKETSRNFRFIEEESNKYEASRILQDVGNKTVVVNPPYPPMTQGELDRSFDLPYTRMPHPKYKGKRIPAFDMIKFSVNLHRGCFGGCAFCTISAHQGKFIVSRSKESILKEVKAITELPDFKGYLSDLGGPSANMYAMRGKEEKICRRCKRPSCIHPKVCPNLNTDHRPLLDIYHSVDALPGIKKIALSEAVYAMTCSACKEEDMAELAVITKRLDFHLEQVQDFTPTDDARKRNWEKQLNANFFLHIPDAKKNMASMPLRPNAWTFRFEQDRTYTEKERTWKEGKEKDRMKWKL